MDTVTGRREGRLQPAIGIVSRKDSPSTAGAGAPGFGAAGGEVSSRMIKPRHRNWTGVILPAAGQRLEMSTISGHQ